MENCCLNLQRDIISESQTRSTNINLVTTTLECPERIQKHIDSKSGTIRKNPYRNQIDFILIRNNKNLQINDSRSMEE